ncbi:MAG: ArsR/SmtB family transcription factor [Acidimicrobiales bacterium]
MSLVDGNLTRSSADLEVVLKALASARRLQILEWLKDPEVHFPPQEHGDPTEDGACNLFIVDKLGVSQPAGSRHLKVLVDAGLVIPTRRKGWTYYRRNEPALQALVADIATI